jgi:parvulin-like peptidyl-prolyl isomerase
MFKKFFSFIVILIAASVLWGCQKKPAAVVNGDPITEEQLQKNLQKNVKQHGVEGAKVDPAALRKAVLDQMISETLLLQGALEANITVKDEEVNKRLDTIMASQGENAFKQKLKKVGLTEDEYTKMLRERMIKEKFVNSLLDEDPVTKEQMKEYYKNSPKPFLKPAESRLRFIQFSDEAKAEEAMKRIRSKKESFDGMAERLKKSGDAIVSEYSWISPDVFSTNIRDALKKMKVGSVDGPFKGSGGNYIFRLKERRPERVKSYEEAKEDIRRILRNEKKAAVVLHWVAAKRRSSAITIN